MRVEKELFTTLFRLAMEDIDMFSELRNCMDRMPWGELNRIGNGPDSSWFRSGVRDGDGSSHSFRIAASQAPEIQPLAPPSISYPHLTFPSSSHQHRPNLDSRRLPQVERRVSPDAMDVDEVPATDLQTSEKYDRMTGRRADEIEGTNLTCLKIINYC